MVPWIQLRRRSLGWWGRKGERRWSPNEIGMLRCLPRMGTENSSFGCPEGHRRGLDHAGPGVETWCPAHGGTGLLGTAVGCAAPTTVTIVRTSVGVEGCCGQLGVGGVGRHAGVGATIGRSRYWGMWATGSKKSVLSH